MTRLRLAAILLAGAALAFFLWPAGERQTAVIDEPAAVSPQARQSAVATPVDSGEVASADIAETDQPVDNLPAVKPPERSSVSGLVRDANGIPMEGVEVIARNLTDNSTELARSSAVSDFRGEFTLRQLLPGRQYRIGVTPHDGHAAFDPESFVAGQIDRLQDIVMRRVSLVHVDGMVVDVDRAPVADFEFVIGSLSTEFPAQKVKSDSSGFFSLREFPAGDIRIATNTADYFRIQGLELLPDEYRNLTLVIDRGSYHLGGWVSDENGAPVVEAQVILKSSFDTGDYQSISNRATITDQSGAFEFARLGGNPATLAVYANGYRTHSFRHRFTSYSDFLRIELEPVERKDAEKP